MLALTCTDHHGAGWNIVGVGEAALAVDDNAGATGPNGRQQERDYSRMVEQMSMRYQAKAGASRAQ